MDLCKRFVIHQQLGEGSFSKIYQAYDKQFQINVALKVEKGDKHKKILKFEYEILKSLQNLPYIPKLYDFVENTNRKVLFGSENEKKTNCSQKDKEGLNFIVMELLGKNVANFKKTKEGFNVVMACNILIQMLNAIEQLHDRGYIHRDIKPANFVVKEIINNIINSDMNDHKVNVYMVDYGLARVHLDRYSCPIPPRMNTDFRGTLTYASLNAHYKHELSRRDDLWSFFFVVLDLLDEILPWRSCKDDKDDIKRVKEECLKYPEKKLFLTTTKDKKQILEILNYLKTLGYADRPNYFYIRNLINEILLSEIAKMSGLNCGEKDFDLNKLHTIINNEIIMNQLKKNEFVKPEIINPMNCKTQNQNQNQNNFLKLPFQNNFLFNNNINLWDNIPYQMNLQNSLFNNLNLNMNMNTNLYSNILNPLYTDNMNHFDFNTILNNNNNYTGPYNQYGMDNNLNSLLLNNPYLQNLNLLNNMRNNNEKDELLKKKRERENTEEDPKSKMHNQILIINQYNKNNMTELESKLLNILFKQNNKVEDEKKSSLNNDMLLISSLSKNSKPVKTNNIMKATNNSGVNNVKNQNKVNFLTKFLDINKKLIDSSKKIFNIEKQERK